MGLSAILVLIGAKMLLVDVVEVPTALSLAVVAAILAGAIVTSVLRPPDRSGRPEGSQLEP